MAQAALANACWQKILLGFLCVAAWCLPPRLAAQDRSFDQVSPYRDLLERIRAKGAVRDEAASPKPRSGSLGANEVSSSDSLPAPDRLAELFKLVLGPMPQGRRRFFLPDRTPQAARNAEELRTWLDNAGLLEETTSALLTARPNEAQWVLGSPASRATQAEKSLPEGLTAKRASQSYSLLGWNPGTYAFVQSEHYEVFSQAGEKSSIEVALACESIRQVWQNVFETVLKPDASDQASGLDRIVLFRSRDAYVRALRTIEPRIAISTGYYSPSHRTVFFYWEGAKSLPTLVHEVTHQLFDRSSSYGFDPDKSPGFWVIEGAALYMESWSEETIGGLRIIDIGGWDAPRLQASRFRRLRDQYWIPWDEFSRANGERLRKESDVAAWYSQACGLAHFGLDQTPGQQTTERREKFLKYLGSVYRNEGRGANAFFDSDNGLIQDYDTYLQVSHLQDSPRPPIARRNEIVLTRCDVNDDQLLSWDASSRKLEWLDLGFTQVTDRLFLEVDQPTWDVKRLSLELTNISDASMSSIAAMDNLTELDLTECKVTDRGIAELAKHRSLRKLWVGGTQVSDESIEVLSSIPKLESLIYEGSAITPQGFVQLARKNPLLRRKPRP